MRSDEGTMERLDGEVFDTYGLPQLSCETSIWDLDAKRRILPLNNMYTRKLTQAERDGDKHALPDTWFQLK